MIATELVEQEDLRVQAGPRVNTLIEADNLDALRLLSPTHSGMIDVLYVDPPYNTGMTNLGYRDNGFDERHGGWARFIEERLVAARGLMSRRAVMYVHADEHGIAASLTLCTTIFGAENVDVLVWPKTDPRFDQNRVERPFRTIKIAHEYVLACYRDRASVRLNSVRVPRLHDGRWDDEEAPLESIVGGWGTTSSAKDEVGEVFGDRYRFQTPKPMRLVKELLRAASHPESVVMDIFAGSGTTGHAVMDLNREDGGERTFILVNDAENRICRDVTYERIKAVMRRESYAESLHFFTIRPVQNGSVQP